MKTVLISLLIVLPLTTFKLHGQDTLNQTIDGLKQGYWIIYGKDQPDKGYPLEGKIEEGPYVDGRKNGTWIKYHKDGVTPRLRGTYKNNRPNGAFIKYHENGVEREIGTYSNRKMTGDFVIKNADGIVTQRKTFNANGKEEGKVEYFFDDGTPQMVMTKKDGVTTGEAITYWPNGDIKKVIVYDESGAITKKEERDRVNPAKGEQDVAGSGGPKGDQGVIKDGKKFNRDGYNKLYNKNDEIWMDGEFKSGKLWNGKLYKYDSDGILLKIEVWKNGKYHSDGQL
jgi:antitoxin component YwqK of YwqJK toxin-antitoxin module